ncbi:tetratricopeptide repeat protein [Hyphomicrobium sp.]|jgi:tetratricopeptide (TPR) repeat protein|uniref:tetratricopeptide repeat protein n=1 Tax=Hyphomicrobium sp. TaxID=82 RepID=UPI0035698B37
MHEQRSLFRELGIFLLLYLVLGAVWLNWGPGVEVISSLERSLNASLGSLASWYQTKLEQSTKLVAPLVTIISGTFAIVTALSLAESRLLNRLRDFLEREEKRLRGARDQLRRTIERPGPARPFEMPFFATGELRSAMRELGWGSYFLPPQLGYVELQLGEALTKLEKQVDLSKQHQRKVSEQLATAHLLKGAMMISRNGSVQNQNFTDRAKLIEALHHFEAAISASSKDLDALEYASYVHVQLGQFAEADKYIDRLLRLTAKDLKSLQRSRALRSKAWIALYGAPSRPLRAKNWIDDAIRALPDLTGAEQVEEADLHMFLGDAQQKLNANRQARSQWEIARAVYKGVDSDEAREGLSVADERLS